MGFFSKAHWSSRLQPFLQDASLRFQVRRQAEANSLPCPRSNDFKISKSFRYVVPSERLCRRDISELHSGESLPDLPRGNEGLVDGAETPPPPYETVASGNTNVPPKRSRIRSRSPRRNLVPIRKAPAVPSGLSRAGRRSHLRRSRGKSPANRAKCGSKCSLTQRTNPANEGNYLAGVRTNAKSGLLKSERNPLSMERNLKNCAVSPMREKENFASTKKRSAVAKETCSAVEKIFSCTAKNFPNRSLCSSEKTRLGLDDDEKIIQKSSTSRGSPDCSKSWRFHEKESKNTSSGSASKIKENASSCMNEKSTNNDSIIFRKTAALKGGNEVFPRYVCSIWASDALFLKEDVVGKFLSQRYPNETLYTNLPEERGILSKSSEGVSGEANLLIKEQKRLSGVKNCSNVPSQLQKGYCDYSTEYVGLQDSSDPRFEEYEKPVTLRTKDVTDEGKRLSFVLGKDSSLKENLLQNCKGNNAQNPNLCKTVELSKKSQNRPELYDISCAGSNKNFGIYRTLNNKFIPSSRGSLADDDGKLEVEANRFEDHKGFSTQNSTCIESLENNLGMAEISRSIELSCRSQMQPWPTIMKCDQFQEVRAKEVNLNDKLCVDFTVHFDDSDENIETSVQEMSEKRRVGIQVFSEAQIENSGEPGTENKTDFWSSGNTLAEEFVHEYFDRRSYPRISANENLGFDAAKLRDRSRVGTRMTLPMPSSSLSSSAVSSSQTSSGPSCSSSAVGSDTQSQRGSDGGTTHDAGCKGASPAPTVSQLADDAASVLKAPSEAPSGVSTLADAEDVGSKAELEAVRRELTQARQTIRLMHEREKEYKERLNERSSRICGSPPARIRVTSPVRPLPHQDTTCSKNCNLAEESSRNNNGDDRGSKSEIPTSAADKTFLRRKEIPKREFGRSKSVVDLVEESSTCSHVNKSWAQNYSREYPKGYINKGPKPRPQHQKKNQFGDSSSVVAVVGPRPKMTYRSPTASTKASEDTGSCCNNTKRLSAGVGSCDSNRQMSAALEANLTGRLENLALGDKRPSALVRRYANLYAQTRVETLDALDQLTEMRNASELKSKLLFSVVVLAFRSATAASSALRQDVRKILQVAPSGGNPQSADNPGFPSSGISVFHKSKSALPDSHVALANSHVALANSVKGLTTGADLSALEAAMATVITANVDTHDLTQNVEDVCQQIWETLYDYPGLKKCEGLLRYVKECVRVAWGLVNQSPPYCIEYETRTYSDELHVRFHTSDPDFDSVRTYLWPALREGVSGPCVQKGVVIT